MNDVTPEEKRRLIRLAILLVILLGTVYALFDLADRIQEAKEKNVVEEPTVEGASEVETDDSGS